MHGIKKKQQQSIRTLVGLLPSAHPDLLAGRGRVAGVALHEDEMRGREVQRAVGGFVAEAVN